MCTEYRLPIANKTFSQNDSSSRRCDCSILFRQFTTYPATATVGERQQQKIMKLNTKKEQGDHGKRRSARKIFILLSFVATLVKQHLSVPLFTFTDGEDSTLTVVINYKDFLAPIEAAKAAILPAHSLPTTTPPKRYNATEYELQLAESTKVFPNLTSAAHVHTLAFFSGFRNQYQQFMGDMFLAREAGHSQIILQTLKWKDLFGTEIRPCHKFLFDVVHWNSFYPQLPRLVEYDPAVHTELQLHGNLPIEPRIRFVNVTGDPVVNASKPFVIGKIKMQATNAYKKLTKRAYEPNHDRDPMDVLAFQSAFRPHPELQEIMDDLVRNVSHRGDDADASYMALHARIEPDMQEHRPCHDKKVKNFTDILDMLYRKFPDPPSQRVLLILNRDSLEKTVAKPNNTNTLAEHNLEVLNQVVRNGLWDGRAKVFEAGHVHLQTLGHPIFSKYYSISGSILSYFLALDANIFIGSEVSSFAIDVETSRFYRGNKQNYHYLPRGIDLATPENATLPTPFGC